MVLFKKWPLFRLFFLANIGQENVFYDILELKKRPFRLKKQQVQTVEKLIFFKGVNPFFFSKMAIFPTFSFSAIYAIKICFTIF